MPKTKIAMPPKQEHPGWVRKSNKLLMYPSPLLMAHLLRMSTEDYQAKLKADPAFKKVVMLYANTPDSEPAKFEARTSTFTEAVMKVVAKMKAETTEKAEWELDQDRLEKDGYVVYASGLCHMSVCTTLSRRELIKRINVSHPTGIESKWKIDKAKQFNTGQSHPCRCTARHEGAMHYLLTC